MVSWQSWQVSLLLTLEHIPHIVKMFLLLTLNMYINFEQFWDIGKSINLLSANLIYYS